MPSRCVEQLLARLQSVKPSSKGWTALCPAHEDRENSLSISEGDDGRVLLKCFAGCATEAIVERLGKTMADLFPGRASAVAHHREIAAQYDYTDESGRLLFQVVRYQPKTFRQRRPDGRGGWIWNLKGVARVLYRLRELLAANPREPVFLPEGEKDVDRLRSLGLVATTNPGGAGKWRPEYCDSLRGRNVVLLPDNDEAGRKHAEQVAASLRGVAAEIKILTLPDLPAKGDVSDWLDAGGIAEILGNLAGGAPAWAPTSTTTPTEGQGEEVSTHRPSQADRLVALVQEEELVLFHDPTGNGWARVVSGAHREIWSCRSKDFKRWLARRFWERFKKVSNSEAISAALNVIEARARFDGQEFTLHNRVADHDGALWYDLADKEWRTVRVTPGGWEIVDQPPILFRRWAHQRPQAQPLPDGDLKQLLEFVNVRDPEHQLLLLIYVVSCLIPDIPHPVLVLHGPQGSAKTSLQRLIRRLVDPSIAETLTLPVAGKELVQQLAHHWAPFYDNVTDFPDWISDAFCRAVTGDGFSKRELYSDDDDVIYAFRRCIGLNGINVATHKPDLLDRAILIALEPIPGEKRQSEDDLWGKFERLRPAIFGAMLDALGGAMALRPTVQLPGLPRMADFAKWGCAIAKAMGYTQDDFLAAYDQNMQTRNEEVISGSPVAAMVSVLMENREEWQGTPVDLFGELAHLAEQHRVDLRSRSWPKAAHSLTRRLNEVKSNLAAAGILINMDRDGRRRQVTFRKSPGESVTSVTSVIRPAERALAGDACDDAIHDGDREASPQASLPNPSLFNGNDACDANDASSPAHTEADDDAEDF